MGISAKELSAIDKQLRFEISLIKKFSVYANICTDQQLRINFENITAQHQNHYNELLKLLN